MAKKKEAREWLSHPVYLDTVMLVNYVATLDNGISYSSEVAERLSSSKEGEAQASGKASLPSLAQLLGLSLTAQGNYRRRKAGDESVETKLIREHTSASLFNRLRERISESGFVRRLESVDDLGSLSIGDKIEISGRITGNPLKQFLDIFQSLASYTGIDLAEEKPVSGNRAKKARPNNQQVRQSQSRPTEAPGADFIYRTLYQDLHKTNVIDMLMSADCGFDINLVMSRQYLGKDEEQYLLGGCFTVLGVVSEIISPERPVNLLRRTTLGLMGDVSADDMMSDLAVHMQEVPGFHLPRPVLRNKGVQIFPIAVFI